MTPGEHTMFHALALDEEVMAAVEKSVMPWRRTTKDACDAKGCGCLHFRPKDDSGVWCKCSHLAHDHYVKKRY